MPNWHRRALLQARYCSGAIALAVVLAPTPGGAQSAPVDSAAKAPAQAPARAELSGVVFANYQYGGPPASRSANRFEAERAYITVRGRLSERASVRVTADVFQQRDSTRDDYYGGWAFRAKYAFLQYELLTGSGIAGVKANARLGLLNTVVVEHEEMFWPRWISNVGLERAGFFSSADAGAAMTLIFPRKLGEVYATVTNGPGYQSSETDRFKDAAVRLTMTPLVNTGLNGLRTLTISPWIYQGARASRYSNGVGSIGPITDARNRDRWGVLVGVNERPITVAGHLGVRREELETLAVAGADSAVEVATADARILSGFAIVRPFAGREKAPARPLGLLLRVDEIEDLELGGDRRTMIAGLLWEVGPRLSLALDYQEQTLRGQPASAAPARIAALDTRTYFLHAVASF